MILSIILGIIGLGIVILVHETGHFLAARWAGIEVEAFSIGWGPKLVGWTRGGTEYRISVLPIGGYCRMKGEHVLQEAWKNGSETIPREPGTFYGVPPWKRIIVAAAGPVSNLIFAVIVLSIIWLAGFNIQSYSNRIALLSEYPLASETAGEYPADQAGLETGDTILSLGGRKIEHYRDLQERVSLSAGKEMSMTVLRDGRELQTVITPEMDPDTGIGKIGVYAWIDPVIDSVIEGSPAWIAGLEKGDRIVRLNGAPVEHTLDISRVMMTEPRTLDITYMRDGMENSTVVTPTRDEQGNLSVGIVFESGTYRSPRMGPLRAIAKGFTETGETVALTVKSIGLLFRGVGVRESITGPIRITYYVGEVASNSFRQGIGSGFSNMFRFLCLLSVAVFFMNLLPIPALDGGLILLFLVEMVKGRSLRPKAVYRYQIIGISLIICIFIFATLNDVIMLAQGKV